MQVKSSRNVFLSKNGFTLIELLVVVLIAGILAAVALPQYNKAVFKARATRVVTFLNAVTKGVDLYELEHDLQGTSFFTKKGENADVFHIDVSSLLTCERNEEPYCVIKTGGYRVDPVYCSWIEGDEDKCHLMIEDEEGEWEIDYYKPMSGAWYGGCYPTDHAFCKAFNSLVQN